MGIILRKREHPPEQKIHEVRQKRQKKLLSARGLILSLPSELLCIICDYLDIKFLTILCCVSTSFQRLVQPMIFKEFHSGLYDQRGLWRRLELLGKTLMRRPILAQMMLHISVQLHKLQHVETLTRLLRPILQLTTNLRSLSLPIHTATAKILDIHAFGYLGRNLKVKTAYESIFSLDELIITRSQFQQDKLRTYYRPDDFQLQCLVIGSCELDHRSTIKLLRGMRSLEVVKLHQVGLMDCASSSCDSKVAEIIGALDSSKEKLRKLTLDISGFRNPRRGASKHLSLDPLLRLQDLAINEHDLTPNATFPASLTSLVFLDWEKQPSFPFTRDLAKKILPTSLEFITSYSRAPDMLHQILEETWGSREIKVDCRELDDSLPEGPFRVPESPS